MKGTSHFPMLENPEKLNELIQQAVNEVGNEKKASTCEVFKTSQLYR